jgi:hypothetical protein
VIAELVREAPSQRALLVIGLAFAAAYVGALMWLMTSSSYNFWGALLIAPILVIVSLPVLARQARREGNPSLFSLLLAGLILKLAAAVLRYWVDFVYYTRADAEGYYNKGLSLAEQFRQLDFHLSLHSYVGTAFTNLVSGAVLGVTGPTKMGGFLVFSWLGFWGLFLFYRAYVIAVPEGRARQYALLLFFMPTLLFWPSEIGKEAWMMLSLGVAAFGVATTLSGKTWRGLVTAGLGLWMAATLRPHMAAMIGLALAAGFLLKKPRPELRQLAPVIKVLGLLVVSVLAVVLVRRTTTFLTNSGIKLNDGLTVALNQVSARTAGGGSGFAPSVLSNPLRAPFDIVTVLFRPLLFDANSLATLASGVEGTFVLLLTLIRFRWITAAVRSVRRQPYVAVAVAYTVMFVLAFSVFANLGTLVRERSQLLPLYLILLTVPPPVRQNARIDLDQAMTAWSSRRPHPQIR